MIDNDGNYQIESNYYYPIFLTINLTLTLVVMLAACLCCRKKVPKNELLGLEGMVKLKNPDEVIVVATVAGPSESQADLNVSTVSNADSEKRSSTAAHRSLPDIPIADHNGDTGSELYETVAEKLLINAQKNCDKSPTPSLKKQISVSQHSSISQADDVSSPYSRVKNSPHNYAKVRSTEHPYAQLNAPSTSMAATSNSCANISNPNIAIQEDTLQRHSQLSAGSAQNSIDAAPQAEIPAASAIAGMISASQDLPYMTPPISNQHFSGDSQDSSKGYTSISVREPLANILAQQPPTKNLQRNVRDANDSHYATVSDDSDETYAAIEDPNSRHNPNIAVDIYTSGSETYAQIQPMQNNSIVVAVEINTSSSHHQQYQASSSLASVTNNTSGTLNTQTNRPSSSSSEHPMPIPPPVDSLRAQMHSRQASSSSNNSSSVCNLGSPKPEKRQANSPLPPTPKSNVNHLQTTTNSNVTSGRNSVSSVIESATNIGGNNTVDVVELETEKSPQRKNKSLSPSKDIEGMYAKVMKKHKFSRNSPSSQNNSPILTRKQDDQKLGISPLDSAAALLIDTQNISVTGNSNSSDKGRTRSNSYTTGKDHGYETIPADAMRNVVGNVGIENRKSDCYANILQKERQQEAAVSKTLTNTKPPSLSNVYRNEKHYETIAPASTTQKTSNSSNDPGYEQLLKPKNRPDEKIRKSYVYDPNYEVLNSAANSDDGYAKVLDKKRINIDNDTIDGYSKVKGEECNESGSGYSAIAGSVSNADANHNYASILEAKQQIHPDIGIADGDETESDHYARIAESKIPPKSTIPTTTSPVLDLPLSAVSTPASLNRLPELLSLTSPSSLNSSSLMHNSSSTTTVTTSTSTMSSRQTPTSSQYESLTGSETDPNYESVCYMNTSREENPYERLQTDISETQLSTSPLTPNTPESLTGTAVASSSTLKSFVSGKEVNTSEVVVDDYFQV